ncbi:type IV secretory system conjugative DNA transfer family protein [Francisella philomiragia]|nr:type IV secretory system conjugative DNA transfer family protein [Francisella philomiragia]MBK2270177.1 type IV secretory system conjugative DNA transfer family protein [Francisella philomiragia]MBK2275841.1 type IV secretory system conjugative DNA transfer family protein [Francisella philomiragia]MBK2305054.1 type IV secretory system conjugative DNA transfer family protein [Francisella philomiragia]
MNDKFSQLLYVVEHNKIYAVILCILFIISLINLGMYSSKVKSSSTIDNTYGGAREATISDLERKKLLVPKKAEKITPNNKYICYGELNGRLIGSEKPLNTCIFSPPGGGKGVTSVKPKLLDCPYPIVCNDVKFENAMECSEYRYEMYGMKAYIIDPFNVSLDYDAAKWGPKQTLHIDLNIGKNVDMNIYVSTLANAIAPKDNSGKNTSHYDDAQIVLEGILYYIISKGYDFPQLFDLVVSEKGILGLRHELLEYNKEIQSPTIMLAAAKIKQLHSEGEMTKYGADVIGILTNGIRLFGEKALRNIFAKGDPDKTLNMDEYLAGKADIYIVVPPNMVEQSAPFIKLMLGLVKSALEFANPVQLKAGYYPMLLDEVAQLGYMKIIEQMYEVLRYKGVVLWLYFQDMSQLKVFAKAPMFKGFNVLQFFEVAGDETVKFIREYAGNKTVEVQSKGHSKSQKFLSNGSTSENKSLAKTELLSTDRIREMDKTKQIIFLPACPVIICDRTPYYSHRRYRGLAQPNLTRIDLAHLIPENNDQVKADILASRQVKLYEDEKQLDIKIKNQIKQLLNKKIKHEKKTGEMFTFRLIDEEVYISDEMFNVFLDTHFEIEESDSQEYLELLLNEEYLTPEDIDTEILYKINR